jgi:hypothetical protein
MPIACTLGADELAAQAERWRRLGARAGLGRVETPHGLRLRFRSAQGVEVELRQLVAVERACCAFADWSLHVDGEEIVLDLAAEGEAVPVVQGMLSGLL